MSSRRAINLRNFKTMVSLAGQDVVVKNLRVKFYQFKTIMKMINSGKYQNLTIEDCDVLMPPYTGCEYIYFKNNFSDIDYIDFVSESTEITPEKVKNYEDLFKLLSEVKHLTSILEKISDYSVSKLDSLVDLLCRNRFFKAAKNIVELD